MIVGPILGVISRPACLFGHKYIHTDSYETGREIIAVRLMAHPEWCEEYVCKRCGSKKVDGGFFLRTTGREVTQKEALKIMEERKGKKA